LLGGGTHRHDAAVRAGEKVADEEGSIDLGDERQAGESAGASKATGYGPGDEGICPSCGRGVQFTPPKLRWDRRGQAASYSLDIFGGPGAVSVVVARCPLCGAAVVSIAEGVFGLPGKIGYGEPWVVWPRTAGRPVPSEVPPEVADLYQEAALVLSLSPRASAALSRLCLETVLRAAGGLQGRDLASLIDKALSTVPSYLARSIDEVRNYGNLGAHPIRSLATGELTAVEPGEAEGSLDLLDLLFQFYYVQAAEAERRRQHLNQKLADAGKPPMKR